MKVMTEEHPNSLKLHRDHLGAQTNQNLRLDRDRVPFPSQDCNRNLGPGQDRSPSHARDPDRDLALLLGQFLVRNPSLDPVQNQSPRRDLLQNPRLVPNPDQKAGLDQDQNLLDRGRNRNLFPDQGLARDQNPTRVLGQVLHPKVSKACLYIGHDNSIILDYAWQKIQTKKSKNILW